MPWKNGKGETAEIAVFPEGAGLNDFNWRLSMATVEESGPFSSFPGVDRVLAVVEGEGLRLYIEGDIETVTPISDAVSFPGDATVASDLLGGPITDLNLMTRRGICHGRIDRVRGPQHMEIEADGLATLVVALSQCVLTGSWVSDDAADGELLELGRLDAVALETGDRAMLSSVSGGLDLLTVRIFGEASHSR